MADKEQPNPFTLAFEKKEDKNATVKQENPFVAASQPSKKEPSINPFVLLSQKQDEPKEAENPFVALSQQTTPVNPFTQAFQQTAATNPFSQAFADPANFKVTDIPGVKKVVDTGRTLTDSVLDFVSRGQYASAKFAETLAKKGASAIGDALLNAGKEFANPKDRLSYKDIMHPEFKKTNPVASELLGFVADIALDPVTYLSFGTGKAIQAAGKTGAVALSKKGAAEVAKTTETILQKSKQAGVGFSTTQARASADEIITHLATLDPSLIDKGGLKFAGVSVLPKTAIEKITKITGMDATKEIIKSTRIAKGLKAFVRDADLPQEYVDIRKSLDASYSSIGRQVEKDTLELFSGFSKAEREQIGEIASKVNDVTSRSSENLGRKLTQAEAQNIRDTTLQSARLNPKQKAIYAKMQQSFKEAGELEIQAGLLTNLIQNYTPRIYEALKNGEAMKIYKRNRQGLSTFLSSSEARVFTTLEEAKQLGYVPELDAAVLYAQRLISSRKKLAHDQFNKGVQSLFGKELPTRVKEDIRFIGEGIYPENWGESTRALVDIFDSTQRAFKKLATVARPAFGVKQIFSNALQGFAVQGAKVFGVLDPRVLGDAMDVVQNKAARFDLKTALGYTYPKEELTQLVKNFDIVRGTTVAGDRFSRSLKTQLRNDFAIKKASMGSEAAEGALKFAQGMGDYMAWPGHIEDFARTSLFLNGLRIGHSPREASALVDKALFNYSNGLSALESQYIKRLIPFYSFQRFAFPLVANTLKNNPGRLAAMAKAGDTFFRVWNKRAGGDELTPAERRLGVPGFILEQTSFLEGFDAQIQAVFKSFNSFSPLDVLGGVVMDEKGDADLQRTLTKAALGQITPIVKWPIELLIGKKFFNDRLIKEGGKIGDVQPQALVRNITTLIAASNGGVFPGALGALVGDAAGRMLPEDVVKRLLGWEEATDINGKRNVFINPYLAHAVESFVPVWSEVVRQSKPDLTPS